MKLFAKALFMSVILITCNAIAWVNHDIQAFLDKLNSSGTNESAQSDPSCKIHAAASFRGIKEASSINERMERRF
jgi:hypothetical protein